jgi:hypothetical protein
MAVERPRVTPSGDAKVDQRRREQAADLAYLSACPFLRGVKLLAQTFAADTDTTINHGLGRTPSGWFDFNHKTAKVQLFVQASDARSITLRTPVAGTCDLWFF